MKCDASRALTGTRIKTIFTQNILFKVLQQPQPKEQRRFHLEPLLPLVREASILEQLPLVVGPQWDSDWDRLQVSGPVNGQSLYKATCHIYCTLKQAFFCIQTDNTYQDGSSVIVLFSNKTV